MRVFETFRPAGDTVEYFSEASDSLTICTTKTCRKIFDVPNQYEYVVIVCAKSKKFQIGQTS